MADTPGGADMPNPIRPDPVELRAAAAAAEGAATALARAVGAAANAGLPIDSEITESTATVTSWASWVSVCAAAAEQPRS